MTNEVAMKFNWAGRDKRPFKKTNMMMVIRGTILLIYNMSMSDLLFTAEATSHAYRGQDGDLSDKKIDEAVKDWLKLAKSRFTYTMNRNRISN